MKETSRTIQIATVFYHNEDQRPKFKYRGDFLGVAGNIRDLAQLLHGAIHPVPQAYKDIYGPIPSLNLNDETSITQFLTYAEHLPHISIKLEHIRI